MIFAVTHGECDWCGDTEQAVAIFVMKPKEPAAVTLCRDCLQHGLEKIDELVSVKTKPAQGEEGE